MKIFNKDEVEKSIEMTKDILETGIMNTFKVYANEEYLPELNIQEETKKTLNLLENILHYIKLTEGIK